MNKKLKFFAGTVALIAATVTISLQIKKAVIENKKELKVQKITYESLNNVKLENTDYDVNDLVVVVNGDNAELCYKKSIEPTSENKDKINKELSLFDIEYQENIPTIIEKDGNNIYTEKDAFVVNVITNEQIYNHDKYDSQIIPRQEMLDNLEGYYSIEDDSLVLPCLSFDCQNYNTTKYHSVELPYALAEVGEKEDIENNEVSIKNAENCGKELVKSLFK